MSENILMMTTAGSKEEAEKIAHTLVERRLAACVNIVPQVQSVYRWEGKVEQAQEWLLLIKTFATALERVRKANKEMNSYELPEGISFHIDGGCANYLKWLSNSGGGLKGRACYKGRCHLCHKAVSAPGSATSRDLETNISAVLG